MPRSQQTIRTPVRSTRTGLAHQDFAGLVIPSRTASMRSRSRRSATRCSSDGRFSCNNILPSSAARDQTGRWRAVMQALGHRVGSQSATSGVARSGAIVQRAGSVHRHRRLRHQPGHTERRFKINGSTGISERPLPGRQMLLWRGCECLLRVESRPLAQVPSV